MQTNTNKGTTLLEIFMAISIMMIALIPIFYHSSGDAEKILETEKIQKADHILESLKEELIAMPFKKFNKATKGGTADELKQKFELPSGFFPVTFTKVLKLQKKYRNFNIAGTWSYLIRNKKVDQTMVQVDMEVNWPSKGTKPLRRTKSMLVVKP